MLALIFFMFGLLLLIALNAIIDRLRFGPYWQNMPPYYPLAYPGHQGWRYREPSKWMALVMAVLFVLLLALTLRLAPDSTALPESKPEEDPSAWVHPAHY